MKTLISQTALLFSAALTTLSASASDAPAAPAAAIPDSCGMLLQAPTQGQPTAPGHTAGQLTQRRIHLLPRECGLVDSDKEVNQQVNTGVSRDDSWQKADDVLELSRHYNEGDEHQLSSPAGRHLHLGLGGSDAAGTPGVPNALMNDAVPSVPEPSSVTMTAAGLLLLGGWSWRLRRRASSRAAAAE
ncbi:MAG: PEP-CTERM sorting domain-containing protein [Pseudomonadota bacterium]